MPPPAKIPPQTGFLRKLGRAVQKLAGRNRPLDSPQKLAEFLESRASYVAQRALFGYMKTRAGTRFPELFENAAMLESINIAKWRMWLACFSDLAVYCGAVLHLRAELPNEKIREMFIGFADDALARAGDSAATAAGADFAAAAQKRRARILRADFAAFADDDSAFTESPEALVFWAPVADELKSHDVEIIRNSVRFRWHEIRRDFRKRLRAREVAGAGEDGD